MRTSRQTAGSKLGLFAGAGLALALAFATVGRLQSAPSRSAAGFWSGLAVNGSQYTRFSNIQQMTDFADVVILGRIDTVARGRIFVGDPNAGERGKAYYLSASVIVDEILAGKPLVGDESKLTIELFAPSIDAIPAVLGSVPKEQTVFFLINKAHHPANANLASDQLAIESAYYEIIGDQAAFRNVDGRAQGRPELDPEDPMARYNGMVFTDLAAEIRSLR